MVRRRDGATAHLGQVRKKIRGMSQSAQAAIEALQPYTRGNGYRNDTLWLLINLCNIDKHRMIHAIAGAYGGLVVEPDLCKNFSGQWTYWSYTAPLKGETVLARYTAVPSDPKLDVHVEINP